MFKVGVRSLTHDACAYERINSYTLPTPNIIINNVH